MGDLAVDIHGLTHRYGDHVALDAVTFGVATGDLFGLLGPNGGGKTTLFRILSTLLQPTDGTAQVGGLDTTRTPAKVRQRLGVVFQQPALDDELTVLENLYAHGALYGLGRTALRQRIGDLMGPFGLAERGKDRVKTLSGGLKRRADLVRGLLHTPAVLLLDEPTTGLDPVARRAFWDALARLRRAEGTTILVATHLLEEADACDHIGILDHGRLVALGTPAALKDALGDETLWLETPDPATLCDQLQARLSLEAHVIGDKVQLSHPNAHTLLPSVYDHFGTYITSATVRQPTLEDVFMIHAGHAMLDA